MRRWLWPEGLTMSTRRRPRNERPSGCSRCRTFGPAYYAHMENIRRHLTIEDYSRVDAMIALRLRSSGHSRESVEETIRACAPTIRGRRAATGSVMPSVQRITPLARPVTGIWKEMSGIGCGGRKLRVEYISRTGLWLESLLCRRQSFLDKNNKFVIMVNGKGNFDV